MVTEAATAGVDAVKFQSYSADQLASKNSPAYWDTNEESTESQHELFSQYDDFGATEFEEIAEWTAENHDVDFLSTPFDFHAVEYLEELTPEGFESFDVELEEMVETDDVNFYRFAIEGTGFFPSIYDFIWQIENRPDFYRIHDLELSRTTLYDDARTSRGTEMVQFSMTLDTYFGGLEGLSETREGLATVPEEVHPSRELPHNSFYPLVRERKRKGSASPSGLVDVRHASLISIAGSRAIFQDGTSQFIVYEGSSVANGTIVRIDPLNVVVRASLVVDGKSEVVDIQMENTPPTYRQAEGTNRLVPVDTDQP